MKLIYCDECGDIRKLGFQSQRCQCGKSHGKYLPDGLYAEIGGAAVPLGFANWSFIEALGSRPQSGLGERFEAFVIPRECPTVAVVA